MAINYNINKEKVMKYHEKLKQEQNIGETKKVRKHHKNWTSHPKPSLKESLQL